MTFLLLSHLSRPQVFHKAVLKDLCLPYTRVLRDKREGEWREEKRRGEREKVKETDEGLNERRRRKQWKPKEKGRWRKRKEQNRD